MRKFLLVLGAAVFSASALASPLQVTSVNGASAFVIKGATALILGGTAGNICAAGTGTCDSCPITTSCVNTMGVEQAPLCACNTQRITDMTLLTINFNQAAPAKSNLYAMGASNMNLPLVGQPNPNSVSVTWAQLCGLAGLATCEAGSFDSTFTIFADINGTGMYAVGDPSVTIEIKVLNPGPNYNIYGSPNNSGLGNFVPQAGDGQIFLTNMQVTTNFPQTDYNGQIQAVTVLASTQSMLDATARTAPIRTSIPLLDDGTLATDSIGGLLDGSLYFVRLGLMDNAGNIVQFYPDMSSLPAACTTGANQSCPFAARPMRPLK